MIAMTATIIGGVGVFLIGMSLMNEGLRAAAGDTLRVTLHRFTRGKFSAIATGAVFTALVQSSSATTLATIGFVSAGLLTFSQAVGVIFGANLGTTSTSWLVSMIGFKFSISAFALPMVGVGALLKLLTKGRVAHIGETIAGFGLIFIGIDFLQLGMSDLSDRIDLSAYAADGFFARLVLVLIGMVMTIVMQSSSAAVAATLTALHTGTIDVSQAAAIVIGQNVGTTVTAALGSIGATLPAKRTALAHILFNLLTGIIAFAILPLFVLVVEYVAQEFNMTDGAVKIAIFHTIFNLLGVIVLLPFIEQFSRLVERMVKGEEPRYVSRLDDKTLAIPAIAVEAVRQTCLEMLEDLLRAITDAITTGKREPMLEVLQEIEAAIDETRVYLRRIHTDPEQPSDYGRHLSVLHALDHIARLLASAAVPDPHLKAAGESHRFEELRRIVLALLNDVAEHCRDEDLGPVVERAREGASQASDLRKELRPKLFEQAARGELTPIEAENRIRALLWLDRIAFHAWRVSHHLGGDVDAKISPDQEPMVDQESAAE